MSFGKTLRRIRRLKDKSQRDVADLANMDVSYLSRLETDRLGSRPTRETIDKLARALECTPEEHSDLIAAGERLDPELMEVSRIAKERPIVGRLFRAAVNLSPEKLEKLIAEFEEAVDKEDQNTEGQ